jgi:hypothetical protein
VKCYYRLATALKSRKALKEAIEIVDIGLLHDSKSVALRKFRATCIKELSAESEHSDQEIGIKKGFLQGNKCKIDEKSSIVTDNDDNEIALGTVEYRMITELKSLIKRILTGNFGSEEMNKHMLQGLFTYKITYVYVYLCIFPCICIYM